MQTSEGSVVPGAKSRAAGVPLPVGAPGDKLFLPSLKCSGAVSTALLLS
jgi:hypothetical protein